MNHLPARMKKVKRTLKDHILSQRKKYDKDPRRITMEREPAIAEIYKENYKCMVKEVFQKTEGE